MAAIPIGLGAGGELADAAPVGDPEGVPLDALELPVLLPDAGAHSLLLLSSNPETAHGVVLELI
jgi:hypothetical protein